MTHRKSDSHKWTGPVTGPVSLLVAVVSILFFSTMALGQTENKTPSVLDALLGIGIGTSLEEAHFRLDSLGVNGGRTTRSGGRKESWALEGTEYSSISLKTNKKGKVVWVTAFVRSMQEIPFETLGDPATSARSNEFEAIWNVETPEGGYRLVAKGHGRSARVIYLLSLEAPPIE